MRRREVIAGLLGTSLYPVAGHTQAPTMLRVGSCSLQPPTGRGFLAAFGQRLAELGYVEGQNLTLDYIDLQGRSEGYADAWRQLVARKADVLVAYGPEEALKTALAITTTTPIVMAAIDFDGRVFHVAVANAVSAPIKIIS